MEQLDLNMDDLEQIEQIMLQISIMQKECNDAVTTVYDENIMVQKLIVLNGGLGWIIAV